MFFTSVLKSLFSFNRLRINRFIKSARSFLSTDSTSTLVSRSRIYTLSVVALL